MDIFVARQPIFDRKKQVVAYELLFRSNSDNYFNNINGDDATLQLLNNSFFSIGIDKLTNGKRAFINFTDNLLKSDVINTLPKESIVIEILETVKIDNHLINSCKELKKLGYTLALDDFQYSKEYDELIKYIDIIKVDFLQTTGTERETIINKFKKYNIKFLAEKVETLDDVEQAMKLGYSYLQGYFFSKPNIVAGKEISVNDTFSMKTLKELQSSSLTLDKLEEITKEDVSLSYKLLKLINSPAYGLKSKVHSIRSALALLGTDSAVRWMTIITLSSINNSNNNKSKELLAISLTRAKFCELAAETFNMKELSDEAFLVGLFSMIDSLLDLPLEIVLEELFLPKAVKKALLGEKNQLSSILDLNLFIEKGQWNKVEASLRNNGFPKEKIGYLYMKSLQWSNETSHI